MRLIDADALEKVLKNYYKPDEKSPYGGMSADAIAAMSAIDNAPTIDAEPVRHGEWIIANPNEPEIPVYECSKCERIGCIKVKTNYCNYCGAMMDGGA